MIVDSRGLKVWKVVLDPLSASGPYEINAESTLKGKKWKISLKDVWFGDVWICGGQSNMQFTTGMVSYLIYIILYFFLYRNVIHNVDISIAQ